MTDLIAVIVIWTVAVIGLACLATVVIEEILSDSGAGQIKALVA